MFLIDLSFALWHMTELLGFDLCMRVRAYASRVWVPMCSWNFIWTTNQLPDKDTETYY